MTKFSKNLGSSEAGFSLVAVLLIMGVVMASILMISQAKYRAQGAQKALKVKQSYSDVNQALINTVVKKFHENMAANCGVALAAVEGAVVDGSVRMSLKPATPVGSNPLPPATHTAARERCKRTIVPSGSSNRYYFCAQLSRDDNAPKDSILNADYAFAEFAIELIDLQTQEPLSCETYASRKNDIRDGSEGLAVSMALYWTNKAGNRNNYSQKGLTYIANQN